MANESSSSPDLLAKTEPPVSLVAHTTAVGETTAAILDTPAVTRLLNQYDAEIAPKTLAGLAQLIGRSHDSGKAHPSWQTAARTVRSQQGPTQTRLPPHSARSALYFFALARQRNLPRLQGIAGTLAVLHHHTPMTTARMRSKNVDESVADISQLGEMTTALAEAGLPDVTIDVEIRDAFLNAVSHYHALPPRDDEYTALGALTTVLRTALIQADHHESAKAAGETAPLPASLTDIELDLFDELRPYQHQIAETTTDRLLGLAGCGEGKTHSALQWGQQMVDTGNANRLVFAMPTQVTTNNLLLSVTGTKDEGPTHVPPDAAGLYHSASDAFYEGEAARERWDLSEPTLRKRARRWFQRPVTVTTVDHVLSTLVNGHEWASVARGNLLQSAVVFDELHAYDAHTTGHILGGISALNEAGVPWYVMSATLPPQLRSHSSLDPAESIVSNGRLSASLPPREPFTVTVERDELDAERVHEAADQRDARRVMVVKNTVAGARELARTLIEDGEEVVYYSSAFTRPHREQKEAEIREQFSGAPELDGSRQFLVSTQVCEISLDLSADLLLTDVAPADAVLQRAGRLHRDGVRARAEECRRLRGDDCPQCRVHDAEFEYECLVFAPLADHDVWYPYATENDTTEWRLLERTADVLDAADTYRFNRSLDWVDSVYDALSFGFDATELRQAARSDWLYGEPRRVAADAEEGSEQLQIRDISTYRRSVLMGEYVEPDGSVWTPSERWQEDHDCSRSGTCGVHDETANSCKRAFRRFVSRHAVEVPQWWFRSNEVAVSVVGRVVGADGGIPGSEIAGIRYTYQLGADPQDA